MHRINKTKSIDYFWKGLNIMYTKLKFLTKMKDRDNIFKTILPVFKSEFPRLISIIGCFEVFIKSSGPFLAYINYKKHCTIEVFISCAPFGSMNFLPKCCGGWASDILLWFESLFLLK